MSGIQEDDDLVFRKICTLIEPLNEKGVKLTRDTDLIADLEIDSVAVLDMVMDIEDTYDISIPVNTISETKTIGQLVDAIHEIKKEQA
ncbi:MAG: acyl carrier protein [Pseudomonadota bacterium]